MVYSAAFTTAATTVAKEPYPKTKSAEDERGVEPPAPAIVAKAADKHDLFSYTVTNASLIGLAGLAAGAQEAYLTFERLPPSLSRQHFKQAKLLFGIIGKKTAYAALLGAVFSATDAYVEGVRGKHDMTSGAIAGAVTGTIFGLGRPMPQPVAWPLAFAATAVTADLISDLLPKYMKDFRMYGPLVNRENWGDPVPPRPPILDTGAAVRPSDPGQFWRGY
ncbi:hypothetical protein VOLCADRAFT_109582 [Volvox carteri f. nagariensis]|uniref:Uncharacterized protein n=1 Tax=Volvox carteri f. nagariensis TaxID=3068 RepID=D8TJP1_VOLCA|nr:uncharacterized protein VOLCADRAFT_109582 [Volvox carteri f. nagariensis]EFJ52577.1 hypothetical protein VOLCADRAFT_109582 [Volvox carteri f. nagariensis]|eukprot:XP_002946650.1 hypothetical protein VOLCADRAFT_109582 [Volvox carteri f. nagariensis]